MVRRIVPNIVSTDVKESVEFYTELFQLEVAMDMGWIVTLVSPDNKTAQLSIVEGKNPDDQTEVSTQVSVSIEVADVDHTHSIAVKRKAPIIYPLTDEAWGVRRFHVLDPSGILLNILSHHSAGSE